VGALKRKKEIYLWWRSDLLSGAPLCPPREQQTCSKGDRQAGQRTLASKDCPQGYKTTRVGADEPAIVTDQSFCFVFFFWKKGIVKTMILPNDPYCPVSTVLVDVLLITIQHNVPRQINVRRYPEL